MAKKSNEEISFSDRLKSWITDNIKTITIISVSVLVLVIAAVLIINAIFTSKRNTIRKENDSLVKNYDVIQEKYNSIKESASEEKDYSEVIKDLDLYITDSSSWANLRAIYLRAVANFNNKDINKAYDDYLLLSEKSPKDSYFKYLSTFGCAVCLEEQNKLDDAKSLYKSIWDEYGIDCPISDRALFGVLRISEVQNNSADKEKYAQFLADNYSSSDYGSYAKKLLSETEAEPLTSNAEDNSL